MHLAPVVRDVLSEILIFIFYLFAGIAGMYMFALMLKMYSCGLWLQHVKQNEQLQRQVHEEVVFNTKTSLIKNVT